MHEPWNKPVSSGPVRLGRVFFASIAVVAIGVSSAWLAYGLLDERARVEAAAPDPAPVLNRRPDLLEMYNLQDLRVEREKLLRGGPWKDGIPSLTTAAARRDDGRYPVGPPSVVRASQIDWLGADDRVIGVTVGDASRAYPVALLNYHEIVNDVLGEQAIAVIYCPLCDSASVVSRVVDGKTYEFGVSGLLYNSNVVFYDRQELGLWSQIGMGAISGPNAGKRLDHVGRWSVESFENWKLLHPQATVVDRDTGYQRDYVRNPYQRYFGHQKTAFPVALNDRLDNKTPVIGVKVEDRARAYPLEAVAAAEGGRVVDRLGGGEIELVADESGVRVVRAPADSVVMHAFWFSWAAFHPGTDVYRPAE